MPAPVERPVPHWRGTLLYVPLLYGCGWLLARPLALLFPQWRIDQLDLAGVAIALLLLLATLPARLRRVWGCSDPWRRLGVRCAPARMLRAFVRGLLKAALLLLPLTLLLLACGGASWRGALDVAGWWNAAALTLGVGFAEELLFRGWLWGELELRLGAPKALLSQAAVFALLHPWYRLSGLAAPALLGGLILLGVVLALQRRADGGALWGAVGLHGGLVGGWFALQAGLLQIAPDSSAWLLGPGGPAANPIGGLAGWVGLALLLRVRWRWWPQAQRGG